MRVESRYQKDYWKDPSSDLTVKVAEHMAASLKLKISAGKMRFRCLYSFVFQCLSLYNRR